MANTNKVRSDKMIEMYLRNFIIKILLCILSPPLISIGGRRSVTDVPIYNYTISIYFFQQK